MTNEEQILSTLNQILEIQRRSLANQEQAIAQQQVSIQRQHSHLRLYRFVLIAFTPILGYLIYFFATMPRSH